MNVVSLFAGIDGFGLAAETMGWDVVAHCEIEPFPQTILQEHFPKSTLHEDIKTTDFTIYRGRVNLVTGGFPCQPVSLAGTRKGRDDERFLWDEMFRAVREISPAWVVAENVRGLLNQSGGLVFEQVCLDLETEGYEVQTFLLPAAGVGAPHERYRIIIVAYSNHARTRNALPNIRNGQEENQNRERQPQPKPGQDGCYGTIPNTPSEGQQKRQQTYGWKNTAQNTTRTEHEPERLSGKSISTNSGSERCREYNFSKKSGVQRYASGLYNENTNYWANFPTQPPICHGNDGFPTELLRQRIREDSLGVISEEEIDQIISKAYNQWRKETIKSGGNAVVLQMILQIFKAIQKYDYLTNI